MTVKELILKLQSYPQDMIVIVGNEMLDEKDSFKIIEEYYNGDSANPKCEILYNVLNIE